MICRLWRGWTTRDNAGAYERIVRGEVIPGIEARSIPGFRAIDLVRREREHDVEFMTLMWFDTLDAVRAFMGEDYEVAHVPAEAQAVLSDFDRRSAHYEVLDRRDQLDPPSELALWLAARHTVCMETRVLRSLELFDGLTDQQLSELAAGGTEVGFEPGLELFREGEHADFWWVLLEGVITLVRYIGGEETVVARMDVPGRWAGGFRAWDEQGVYLATGRAATGGRVLRIPAEVLRDRMSAWFPLGGHLIEGLYRTARSIEATARQRQSLVTLGTLAAGLAHEINNPAAAAVRAAGALEDACQALVASVSRLAAHQVSAQQLGALDMLRQDVTRPAAAPDALALDAPAPDAPALDALALADHEDALAAWLARHGVADREWTIAPSLAAAGADLAWCERAAAILEGPALEPGLEWVASALSAAALLAEMKESSRRISALVSAIKSYSQMDRASMQRIDITDGLESTLVMLAHKLRDGVTVVRDYGAGIPPVQAHAGELNQVWTNLIDNAVEAMDGKGTLRLSTRAEDDAVVIDVGDSGPGMPPHVAARAFEPFFTTKEVGKGTGLGLDIARRIVVERHGGTIAIDSRPGSTVLRVRIPSTPSRTA